MVLLGGINYECVSGRCVILTSQLLSWSWRGLLELNVVIRFEVHSINEFYDNWACRQYYTVICVVLNSSLEFKRQSYQFSEYR